MASELDQTEQTEQTDQNDQNDQNDQHDQHDQQAPDTGAQGGGDAAPVTDLVDESGVGSGPTAPPADAQAEAAPAPRTRTRKTAAAKTAKTAKTATKATAARAAKAAAASAATDPAGGTDTAGDTTAAPVKAAKTARTTKRTAGRKAAAPAETASEPLGIPPEAAEATPPGETTAAAGPVAAETSTPVKRGRRRSARPAEEPATETAAGSLVDEDALRFDLLERPEALSADHVDGAAAGNDEDVEDEETGDQLAPIPDADAAQDGAAAADDAATGAYGPLFQAPTAPSRRRRRASAPSAAPDSAARGSSAPGSADDAEAGTDAEAEADEASDTTSTTSTATSDTGEGSDSAEAPRRRRRRGGKGRRGRSSGGAAAESTDDGDAADGQTATDEGDVAPERGGQAPADGADDEGGGSTSRRRTRRRRRSGGSDGDADEPGVTTKVREPRRDEVTALKGSTRLEAKKQRRREGREAGRRRTIITEAEFLARRESVDRVMVVRHVGDRTQIGVLEDGVLVEHYISKETSVSMAGNIYLGRVQNVLPSMEAAFVDIGKGRNAVLYAGEVNWDAAGLEANQPKRIENALTSGESVLVQVTKDPIGHKGARLTSQISLPGRYLVYVPNSSMTGISRKLPDVERTRLKKILKEVVPDTAGVIVRTAAEGASEEELKADVERLTATWADITAKAEAATGGGGKKKNKGGNAPLLLHGEPDLTVRVIRDIFNEDFAQLVVDGDQAWQEVSDYVSSVAPDLAERISRWTSEEDLFTHYRVDEQIAKAMDRKVWLPSGGSLVIDRTEAMTVVDVNTGKFIGSGGNLEETVTKNNIEAAEEIVRQLRLRDVGGIIVIDFIDMVLESNRDLVVRRLLECLGRDRTKHQVAEVTSLGLVQMTRKRVGSGLIEVFSETCEVCGGRGIIVHSDPVDKSGNGHEHADNGGSPPARVTNTRGRGRSRSPEPSAAPRHGGPTPAQIAAAAHAAAMKSNGFAGDDESGAAVLGQDAPLDVVQELDLEDLQPTPATLDEAPSPTDVDVDVEAEVPLASDAVEPPTEAAEPVEAVEAAEAVEAPQADPEPVETAYAPPAATAPSRPRRHRGRVVAPAGPPRAVTPGGGTDG